MTAKVHLIKSREFSFSFDTCEEVSAIVRFSKQFDWETKVDWITNTVIVCVPSKENKQK